MIQFVCSCAEKLVRMNMIGNLFIKQVITSDIDSHSGQAKRSF